MVIVQLTILGAVGYLLYRLAKGRYARAAAGVTETDENGGKVVPVVAAFLGVRGLPWWFAVASNNANPTLVVLPTSLRYRVIGLRERPFSAIEQIDVRTAWKTVNIEIRFHGTWLTLAFNVGATDLARQVLALLPASAPMTSRAQSLLKPPTS
jgi:hypothetical protein